MSERASKGYIETEEAEALADRVRQWIADRDRADGIIREWQGLETRLYRTYGAMSQRRASRQGIAEGTEMRLLDIRYRRLAKILDRAAAAIAQTSCRTVADAMAKIEMGLRIEHPIECEACSWVLIHDGYRELEHMTAGLDRRTFGPAA